MLRDIPKGLANTVRGIVEKSRQQYVEEKAEEAKRIAALREAKGGTVPKTAKEKSLAALAEPKDKITHADVMKGRGVTKEGWDEMMKAVKERSNPQPNGGQGKKQGSAYGGSKQKDAKDDVKEEAEHVEEKYVGFNKLAADKGPALAAWIGRKKYGKDKFQAAAAAGKKLKEEAKPIEELTDTPGNSTHQCAIHVKSEQFGEGRPLFSQHAEPDADGNIAWYDIMFEHGIEKAVPTAELEILETCSHGNHKKKGSK